jgi:hypothetical protein
MLKRFVRFSCVLLAFVWLSELPGQGGLQAQTYNCACDMGRDAWRFVLVNPHCGGDTDGFLTYANDAFSCEAICWNSAPGWASQACSIFSCDNPPDPSPSQYSYSYCWEFYDTSDSGCVGPVWGNYC